MIEDKQGLQLTSVNYLTYDPSNKKFLAITLEQAVRNICIFDDRGELLPKAIKDAPAISTANSLKEFNKKTLEVLLWINQYRF